MSNKDASEKAKDTRPNKKPADEKKDEIDMENLDKVSGGTVTPRGTGTRTPPPSHHHESP